MNRRYVLVEPLLERAQELVANCEEHALEQALTLFGTARDVGRLEAAIRIAGRDASVLPVVDMTPFQSTGAQSRLKGLSSLYAEVPFLLLARQRFALEQFEWVAGVTCAVCDENHQIIEIVNPGDGRQSNRFRIHPALVRGGDILQLHSAWVEQRLLELIPNAVREPENGMRYLELHDGAWANKWLDVKSLLRTPSVAFFTAYEVGYALTDGYSRDLDEDVIVASNNTAFVIASLLQQLFDHKQLVMIDRLGPVPNIARLWLLGLDRVDNKRICMIEDVMSTGREVDMTEIIARVHHAEISRAISMFDLEVASSRLVSKNRLLALCRPSKEIQYSRLPKYTEGA